LQFTKISLHDNNVKIIKERREKQGTDAKEKGHLKWKCKQISS
jgi:hypothetical protein